MLVDTLNDYPSDFELNFFEIDQFLFSSFGEKHQKSLDFMIDVKPLCLFKWQ